MRKNKLCGIYCIENLSNGRKYIGQSADIKDRWGKHRSELKRQVHHCKDLQKDYDEFGLSNFDFYVLELCSPNMLDDKEKEYIQKYETSNPEFGYNRTSGGHKGTEFTENAKEAVSVAIKNSYTDELIRRRRQFLLDMWADPVQRELHSGKNNGMYGRTHTEETRKKISELRKNTPNWRRNRTPVFCEELEQAFTDATDASQQLEIDSGGILKVCRGERKIAGGYHWHFI